MASNKFAAALQEDTVAPANKFAAALLEPDVPPTNKFAEALAADASTNKFAEALRSSEDLGLPATTIDTPPGRTMGEGEYAAKRTYGVAESALASTLKTPGVILAYGLGKAGFSKLSAKMRAANDALYLTPVSDEVKKEREARAQQFTQAGYWAGIGNEVLEGATDVGAFLLEFGITGKASPSKTYEIWKIAKNSPSFLKNVIQHAAKTGAITTAVTEGDMEEKAKSAMQNIAFGLTGPIANATGATGLTATGVNAGINVMLNSPTYAKTALHAKSFPEWFAQITPQLVLDIGFAATNRGLPKDRQKLMLMKYHKDRVKDMHPKEFLDYMRKLQDAVENPPEQINDLRNAPIKPEHIEEVLGKGAKPAEEAAKPVPEAPIGPQAEGIARPHEIIGKTAKGEDIVVLRATELPSAAPQAEITPKAEELPAEPLKTPVEGEKPSESRKWHPASVQSPLVPELKPGESITGKAYEIGDSIKGKPEEIQKYKDEYARVQQEMETMPKDTKEEIRAFGDSAFKSQFLREVYEKAENTGSAKDRTVEEVKVSEDIAKAQNVPIKTVEAQKEKEVAFAERVVGNKLAPEELSPPQEQTAVQKVVQALKEVRPARREQETIYHKERGERFAKAKEAGRAVEGQHGFYAEKAQLKGEFTKAEFESLKGKINQEDIDTLFKAVAQHPDLSYGETLSARTGLAKLFGEHGGAVPTKGEIILLNKVFPKEFTDALLDKRDIWLKAKEAGMEIANVPRAIMASFDLSFGLRQGVFVAARHPVIFWEAFGKQFSYFGSEKALNALYANIRKDPNFELMKDSKLAFTSTGKDLSQREEVFMSNLAEKIPLLGNVVKASNRAYTGMANKIRTDMFNLMLKNSEKLGLDMRENKDLALEVADYINNATGRGSKLFGKISIERQAVALNAFFFSPRLMASRTTLLNPAYYISASSFVRKEALESLLAFSGSTAAILGLAALSGAKVGTDLRSSDFGKIIVHNTRFDIMGGFQQYLRMTAQLASGQYVSSTTGKKLTLGEGYKPITRLDILMRQIESKEAPIFSFATALLKGQDFAGKPISVPKEVANRFIPMVIADTYQIAKDDPGLLPLSIPALFGVGVQTYDKPKSLFK